MRGPSGIPVGGHLSRGPSGGSPQQGSQWGVTSAGVPVPIRSPSSTLLHHQITPLMEPLSLLFTQQERTL